MPVRRAFVNLRSNFFNSVLHFNAFKVFAICKRQKFYCGYAVVYFYGSNICASERLIAYFGYGQAVIIARNYYIGVRAFADTAYGISF